MKIPVSWVSPTLDGKISVTLEDGHILRSGNLYRKGEAIYLLIKKDASINESRAKFDLEEMYTFAHLGSKYDELWLPNDRSMQTLVNAESFTLNKLIVHIGNIQGSFAELAAQIRREI